MTTHTRLQTFAMGVLAAIALTMAGSCGGSPTRPGEVTPPPPPVVTPNTPPIVESITASVSRAEVDTEVTLTATVRDAETPVAQLKYEWTAPWGAIAGTGSTVTFRLPKDIATPADVTVRLTVGETLSGGVLVSVNGNSPVIRVHDSPKEVGALSLAFLGDFANSSVSPSSCVRDFSDACSGKAAEKVDVERNREFYVVLDSTLRLQNVRVAGSNLSADASVACSFRSRIIKCEPGSSGCVVGATESVAGTCSLTAVYEQRRWWLCTSSFNGTLVPVGFRSFLAPRKD